LLVPVFAASAEQRGFRQWTDPGLVDRMSGHCYSHGAFGTVNGLPFAAILMGMALGTLGLVSFAPS
jgi:hypothetical protein